MAGKEFSTAVRGSGTDPISTTQAAAFEVDNYNSAGSFSGSPPANVDPTETIQELIITKSGADSTVTFTLLDASTVTLNLEGTTPTINTLQIDSMSFGGTSEISGMWVGE